jgi:DNA-binding NarL/FixJ family response regulator
LTGREADVLRLVAKGQSNKEIAAELALSVRTVERHITNLYAKINARGKADATSYAIHHGIV